MIDGVAKGVYYSTCHFSCGSVCLLNSSHVWDFLISPRMVWETLNEGLDQWR